MENISNTVGANELDIKMLEVRSGVYFLYNEDELVYIGQAQNIAARILQHICEGVKDFNRVRYDLVPIESLNVVETALIKSLKPRLNKSIGKNRDSEITKKSTITVCPYILPHHVKKDGTMNVKIRVSYKRRSFYIKTNFFVYREDVSNCRIINDNVLKDIDYIVKKYRDTAKYISLDCSFEFVKKRLLSIKI